MNIVYITKDYFKKGTLELCILHFLIEKDSYGYELCALLEEKEASIYSALKRMQKNGLIFSYESQSPRKILYYRITEQGRDFYVSLRAEWDSYTSKINQFLS